MNKPNTITIKNSKINGMIFSLKNYYLLDTHKKLFYKHNNNDHILTYTTNAQILSSIYKLILAYIIIKYIYYKLFIYISS